MDITDTIKNRLSIEEVVSKYVSLKKVGKSYKAICPFHKEKTASFIVSPEKQLAYCFGCQKGGDIFSFIQEIEKVDFKESLEILAGIAGIEINQIIFNRNSSAQSDKKSFLFEIQEEACKFFQSCLKTPEGKFAMDYLIERGLNEAMINQFRIGYAAKSFESLKKYLLQKGFCENDLISGGLVSQPPLNTGSSYDRFRNRVIFPIWNNSGKIAGFSGRILDPQDEPKYLNTSETFIYTKGKILYGFCQSKEEIRKKNRAIIVEGNMDVIASHQVGIKEVVAVSGTALTIDQLAFLKRYTSNIYLAFDSDNAGINALGRAILLCQSLELAPLVIKIDQKDPDELIRKNPEMWEKAIDEAQNYFDYSLLRKRAEIEKKIINSKEGLHFLLVLIKTMRSAYEKDQAIKKLSSYFLTSPDILYDELKGTKVLMNKTKAENTMTIPKQLSIEEYFWAIVFEYPELLANEIARLRKDLFSPEFQTLFSLIQQDFSQSQTFLPQRIKDKLDPLWIKRLSILSLYAETHFQSLNFDLVPNELLKIVDRLWTNYYDHARRLILREMKSKSEAENNTGADNLLLKYNELLEKKRES